MAIEYLGLSSVNGPFVVLEGVQGASFDEVVEITVDNGGLPERYELEFSEEHPGRAARMEGDAALLRRMLDNLIRNSIVHNPQGCRISVTVGAEDGRCVSTVTDDGVGVDAAWLEALNREADVSSTQGGEHGLGLKLVRQIVKAHGGTVQFRQVAPHGLDICIIFPAYEIS